MTALPLRKNADATPGRLVSIDSESAIYRDGSYLKNNPSWHIEESPFKVRQIQRMIQTAEVGAENRVRRRLRRRPGAVRTTAAFSS